MAGRVETLRGRATARGARSGQRDLKTGDPVFVLDTVQTASRTRATLSLGERTRINLGEHTRVRIEAYLLDAGGELNLESGALLFDRQGPSAGGVLNIKNEYVLIAVRGTRVFAGPSNSNYAS